jgi:hypothetical protein
MSLSKLTRRIAYASLVLGLGMALSACSFSPVYQTGTLASQPKLNLAYAKPTSRIEQIIYQDLALRFGETVDETSPLVTVSTSTSGARIGISQTSNPNETQRLTLTATATITYRDGSKRPPLAITRTASADYTTTNQVLANIEAAGDAGDRAAKAAAESLRLALLAVASR